MSLINTQVQPFKAQAFHNGKFIEVTEASLKGKWSVVVFMPAAFTFNCPTEIEDAAWHGNAQIDVPTRHKRALSLCCSACSEWSRERG